MTTACPTSCLSSQRTSIQVANKPCTTDQGYETADSGHSEQSCLSERNNALLSDYVLRTGEKD